MAFLLFAAALSLPGGMVTARAQQVSVSPGPDKVAITVYRDPDRESGSSMDVEWLDGYALVTEVRHIAIQAGEAEIRFEGVAGGIIPESAIVSGLPEGVIEKNQDAYLLSPESLLDRSLGKRVHIRRTSRETGEVSEQDAVIRTGSDGAVVLQTAAGFEALRCTGLDETLTYDGVPEGLSAKPTLSVRTRSAHAANATVALSYLTTGFDWQANYVATLSPDEDRVDLFAWVTLANSDETSFANADIQTVAGHPNREDRDEREPDGKNEIRLRCWPAGTTSDIPLRQLERLKMAPAPELDQEIVVTGIRASLANAQSIKRNALGAVQEELGDLKLYRIPEPVTVASKSQKQVALLEKPGVKVETLYRTYLESYGDDYRARPMWILKTRNRKREGLGLPLPAGGVLLFGAGKARPLLLGQGWIEDRAVDEDVEVELNQALGVTTRIVRTSGDNASGDYLLTVTNDHARPIRFEALFGRSLEENFTLSTRKALKRRSGRPLWSVTVPANGTASLAYRLKAIS